MKPLHCFHFSSSTALGILLKGRLQSGEQTQHFFEFSVDCSVEFDHSPPVGADERLLVASGNHLPLTGRDAPTSLSC